MISRVLHIRYWEDVKTHPSGRLYILYRHDGVRWIIVVAFADTPSFAHWLELLIYTPHELIMIFDQLWADLTILGL